MLSAHRETLDGPNGESLSAEDVITAAIANNEFSQQVDDDGLTVLDDDPLDGFSASSDLDCAEGYEAADTECGKFVNPTDDYGITFWWAELDMPCAGLLLTWHYLTRHKLGPSTVLVLVLEIGFYAHLLH